MSRYNQMAERFGLPCVTVTGQDMGDESLEARVARLELDLEVDPDEVLPEVPEESEVTDGDA